MATLPVLASIPLDRHPYRVVPGTKVRLDKIDPADQHLYEGDKSEGKNALVPLAAELGSLQNLLYAQGRKRLLVVLQAMDTAGKDGTIRDVFADMDAIGVRVVAFKAPSEPELAHDYLWRVHSQVPRNGEVTVFNRSHYEDVIVVRVRGFAPEERWSKRFDHIRCFEQMLVDEGTTIVKFFLHISKEEQKERLQSRLDDPEKRWKFNPADLEDRARWSDYQRAYEEVLSRTSTEAAPWYVIPANRKWYRNLVISRILIDTMTGLKMEFPKPDFDHKKIIVE
ncbi:MAG: polyphosphate kinase 2 family protein [Verrucomicrobiales bacterium]|nr:polyphosphate kinase 2 family protein [Verrucomicrobiae bacterium]MCP5553106.1 polyphosphate kinase 2 family protein [Akkermansiaceae bacterium]